MKAKFHCHQVMPLHHFTEVGSSDEKYAEYVTLMPVYGPEDNQENRTYWKATPSGSLTMQIDNPAAWGEIVVGGAYYVTIEPAQVP